MSVSRESGNRMGTALGRPMLPPPSIPDTGIGLSRPVLNAHGARERALKRGSKSSARLRL
jgi:hypothetical protein